MNVNEILNEQDEDCIRDRVREFFHKDYEDIYGVDGASQFEDVIEIMQEIGARERGVNFQKEIEIFNNILQKQENDVVYISTDNTVQNKIKQIYDIVDHGENFIQRVTAIQAFARLLGKHTITETDWENSDEGMVAQRQAEDDCEESSDPYERYGVREKDF